MVVVLVEVVDVVVDVDVDVDEGVVDTVVGGAGVSVGVDAVPSAMSALPADASTETGVEAPGDVFSPAEQAVASSPSAPARRGCRRLGMDGDGTN